MSLNRERPVLHPQLKTALGFLDLDLEAELAQYRRHRVVCNLKPVVRQDSEVATPEVSGSVVALPEITAAAALGEPLSRSIPLAAPDPELAAAHLDSSITDPVSRATPPHEFLASSEALLKDLNQPNPDLHRAQPRPPLFTAWRVAAGAVFIASGVLLYHILRPAESPVVTQETTPPAASPEAVPSPAVSPPVAGSPSPVPNLAQQEFPDVNLSTLSQLEREQAGQTAAAPTVSSPTPTTVTSPAPQSSQPPPKPATQPGQPVPTAPFDAGRSYYYVVVDYADPADLSQARRIIADAYVVNFPDGAQIQMAVFDNRQAAEVLVKSLNRAGVPAKVRLPS